MLRFGLLALTVVTLMPLGGCVRYCSDSRGKVVGHNYVPFARKYTLCGGNHCLDRNGQHLDVRCRCSKQCDCWGATSVAMAVDSEGRDSASDDTGACDGCGGGS